MTIQKDLQNNEKKYLHEFIDFANKCVLEIGCGEGRLTWQYANKARLVTGIDLDADALRVGIVERPSDLEAKVHFSHAKSEQLPFSKEAFDITILAWSF